MQTILRTRRSERALRQSEEQFPLLVNGVDDYAIYMLDSDDHVTTWNTGAERIKGYKAEEVIDRHFSLFYTEQDRRLPRRVDLLFTDVGLPDGMNGRELADEAGKRRPGPKVLFTTGYARNAIIHHGRLDAGVDLVTKPYPQTELPEKVRKVLDQ